MKAEDFGNILYMERLARGMTRKQVLVNMKCMSQEWLFCCENGRRLPRLDSFISWADAFGYDIIMKKRE